MSACKIGSLAAGLNEPPPAWKPPTTEAGAAAAAVLFELADCRGAESKFKLATTWLAACSSLMLNFCMKYCNGEVDDDDDDVDEDGGDDDDDDDVPLDLLTEAAAAAAAAAVNSWSRFSFRMLLSLVVIVVVSSPTSVAERFVGPEYTDSWLK